MATQNNHREKEPDHNHVLPVFDIKSDTTKLQDYKKLKFKLAAQLHVIREAFQILGREETEQQCRELIAKLAEDRFVLAVVGQFKRGKSTLMNAIIGKEILPTGVVPITSAITTLKYGPAEKLKINRPNLIFPEELPVSALSEYVTEQENPSNQKDIKNACLELPVPFLRYGIEFVDTPGIGSTIPANSITAYNFLPECDAVLFVTGVDIPFSNVELEFLKDIQQSVNKIFFVVNKIDLTTEAGQEEIVSYISKSLNKSMISIKIKIFPVSAQMGLKARISRDEQLFEKSGLKTLEEALSSFLSEGKSGTLIASLAQKAINIVNEEALADIFGNIYLQNRFNFLQKNKSISLMHDPYQEAVKIYKACEKLEKLAGKESPKRLKGILKFEQEYSNISREKKESQTSEITSTYKNIDIGSDLEIDGCPVCNHLAKISDDYLTHWQYILATEEQTQTQFAEESGFCPVHMWQLFKLSSPQGAAVGFAPLAERISIRLKEMNNPKTVTNNVRDFVCNLNHCRVCKIIEKEEKEYIRKLATKITDENVRDKYDHSKGVCLHHLGMLIEAVSSKEIREFLISHAARQFETAAEDMRNYAIKVEAFRRELHNADEEGAVKRTVTHLVGDKRLFTS